MGWKWFGSKKLQPNFKGLPWNLPGGTKENHENLSQDSQSLGRDLNPGPPEYEADVLTDWPQTFSNNIERIQ
jgi:hypothetical protein